MDNSYIINKLVGWAKLFYGKDSGCYAKYVKEGKKKKKKEYYVFGSADKNVENKVDKKFALYLVANTMPAGIRKKIRYQITYFNLETRTTFLHANGGVFTPDKAEAEIRLLKSEQKQLKKLGLPKTKTKFSTKKITIV
jgi:hypothetical protein